MDTAKTGALKEAILRAVSERGPLYSRMTRDFGEASPRVLGSAELRGANRSFVAVIGVDEHPIRACGDAWIWGDTISFSVCQPRVEGVRSVDWSEWMLEDLSRLLPVHYGAAHDTLEYDAKNMSREGGGLRAIGVDVARGLPGLYWLNFFGQPYRDMIGRDRLLSAPAHEVRDVGSGVLMMLHPDPLAWGTSEYKAIERRILDHLGREYFFDRNHPERGTIAPRFELPPRPHPSLSHTVTVDLEQER